MGPADSYGLHTGPFQAWRHLLPLFRAILRRASRCPYRALLEKHCPLPEGMPTRGTPSWRSARARATAATAAAAAGDTAAPAASNGDRDEDYEMADELDAGAAGAAGAEAEGVPAEMEMEMEWGGAGGGDEMREDSGNVLSPWRVFQAAAQQAQVPSRSDGDGDGDGGVSGVSGSAGGVAASGSLHSAHTRSAQGTVTTAATGTPNHSASEGGTARPFARDEPRGSGEGPGSGYITQDDEMGSPRPPQGPVAAAGPSGEGGADHLLAADTPGPAVAAFVWSILRRIIPSPLLGGANPIPLGARHLPHARVERHRERSHSLPPKNYVPHIRSPPVPQTPAPGGASAGR